MKIQTSFGPVAVYFSSEAGYYAQQGREATAGFATFSELLEALG